jgi:DNA processing protein
MTTAGAEAHGLPIEAFGAALAALPAVGPGRLAALLDAWPADEAWARVREGRAMHDDRVASSCQPAAVRVASEWRRASRATDVAARWSGYAAHGVGVHVLGQPGYPAALAEDHDPPRVLFHRGDLEAIDGTCVSIVGTRRCTRYGHDLAVELGHDLASAGVRVVSGLALGIDGAAHRGALDSCADGGAPPVGVVGSGLDVTYPRAHGRLWAEVAGVGVLLSEAPLGAAPEPWRFPARNRIIAALGSVVVVVESHPRGGSRHTVDEAAARGKRVLAVPGSVRSAASAFTNELLAEGCHPARDVTDVLVALGLSTSVAAGASGARRAERRPAPDALGSSTLDALGWEAANLDELAARTAQPPARLSVVLNRLERDGWVAVRGGWWERITEVGG